MTVGIAPGEPIDKVSILEIKAEPITEPAMLKNVRNELQALLETRDASIFDGEGLAPLAAELKFADEALWDIEDQTRDCESAGDFGERFIALARSVYQQNDRRAAIKRRINERLGSEIIEERSYRFTSTDRPAP